MLVSDISLYGGVDWCHFGVRLMQCQYSWIVHIRLPLFLPLFDQRKQEEPLSSTHRSLCRHPKHLVVVTYWRACNRKRVSPRGSAVAVRCGSLFSVKHTDSHLSAVQYAYCVVQELEYWLLDFMVRAGTTNHGCSVQPSRAEQSHPRAYLRVGDTNSSAMFVRATQGHQW